MGGGLCKPIVQPTATTRNRCRRTVARKVAGPCHWTCRQTVAVAPLDTTGSAIRCNTLGAARRAGRATRREGAAAAPRRLLWTPARASIPRCIALLPSRTLWSTLSRRPAPLGVADDGVAGKPPYERGQERAKEPRLLCHQGKAARGLCLPRGSHSRLPSSSGRGCLPRRRHPP